MAWYKLGHVQWAYADRTSDVKLKKDKLLEAISSYNESIRLEPTNHIRLTQLADAYKALGDTANEKKSRDEAEARRKALRQ